MYSFIYKEETQQRTVVLSFPKSVVDLLCAKEKAEDKSDHELIYIHKVHKV